MPSGIYKRQSLQKRFWSKVQKSKSCWLWIGAVGTHGYGRMGHQNKTHQAHRISWLIHSGPIPKNKWVLHKCDNRKCINPNHLFIGERQDNVNDCVKKKRHIFGEKSKLTKITSKEVLIIRKLWKKGITQKKIAKLFKIDQSNVSYIVNLKSRIQEFKNV